MILVTGGTGLIGTHLLFQLVLKGQNVRALKRKGSVTGKTKSVFSYYSDDYESLFARIEWVEGDILDYPSLLRAMDGVSYVYHTAAIVSFDEKDNQRMHHNNEQGTLNIVEACRVCEVKKLCHVSSIAVFDCVRQGERVSEESHWMEEADHSAYSVSKKKSEQYVWEGIHKGLNAIIVNPSIILGPGNWERGSSLFFSTAARGLKVCTPGGNSFVDVRDVVRAMILLMEGPFRSENFILSAQTLSFMELFSAIAPKMNHKPPLCVPSWTGVLAWKFIRLRNLLWPGQSALSRRTLQSAYHQSDYSGQKMVQRTGFTYTPISQTIGDICVFYQKDKP